MLARFVTKRASMSNRSSGEGLPYNHATAHRRAVHCTVVLVRAGDRELLLISTLRLRHGARVVRVPGDAVVDTRLPHATTVRIVPTGTRRPSPFHGRAGCNSQCRRGK